MPWPLSQDYNEAIQNPSTTFADAELKQGEAVTNALGLPQPCSGNFADVYAVQAGNRKWAVKCFTRQIPGLQERYVQISKYLQQVNLPFMVEFSFLEQGIRVRGQWYPVLKMQWVEGFALNTFVRDNLDKPQVLQTLCQIWLKLAQRLREANLAHCDLQHGNVLLVPGSKAGSVGVKLVDYDGMCVPALELLKSIELGHANFQHPQRLKEGTYGLEIDRFPHLAIYTALRALTLGGKALWDKFDTGDNLLFTQKDFVAPTKSPVFAELFKLNDAEVKKLAGALMVAVQKPIDEVPLLDELVETKPAAKPHAAAAAVKPAAPIAENVFAAATSAAPAGRRTKYDAKKKSSAGVAIAAGIGVVVLIGGIVTFATMRGSPTSKVEAVAEVHKTQASRTVSVERPTTTLRPETKPVTRPEAKIEPKPEPKEEPKTEPKKEPKEEPKPEPKTEPKSESKVDLLKRIDLAKDSVAGKWTIEGKALVSPASDIPRMQLAYAVPREYDLTVRLVRKQNIHTFAIGLPCGDRRVLACFDAWSPDCTSGLETIDDKVATVNETGHRGQLLKMSVRAEIVCSVRKGSITTSVDGKKVCSYKGDMNRLAIQPHWEIPNRQFLFIGSYASSFEITKIELTKITESKTEPKTEPTTEPKKEPVVKGERTPVPDAEAQAKVEKEIRELFKTELAKKQPAERLVLAAKLFEQARDAKDEPIARFVLLRKSRDLAALAGDFALALKAVDALAKDYAVNGLEMKTTVLETAGRGPLTTVNGKTLVENAFALTEDAITLDDYNSAARLIKVAEAVATRIKSASQTAAAHARARELDPLRREWQRSKEAAETLAANPEDKGANLILGWFQCLMKGQWEQGLPRLGKGSDTKLAALAQKELGLPADAAEHIALGDAWRDLGKTEQGRAKAQVLRRAYAWYEEALARGKGVTRTKAEQRLAELDKHIANPQLTILFARYGGHHIWVDVTAKAQQFVQGPKLSCKVEDLYEGDPASGVHKALVVVYRFGEGTYLTIKGTGAAGPLTIPPGPEQLHKRLSVGPLGLPFRTIHGEYGGDTGWTDVTERLPKFSDGTKMVVTAENQFNDPDPAPFKYKALVVVYKHKGQLQLSATKSNEPTVVPSP